MFADASIHVTETTNENAANSHPANSHPANLRLTHPANLRLTHPAKVADASMFADA